MIRQVKRGVTLSFFFSQAVTAASTARWAVAEGALAVTTRTSTTKLMSSGFWGSSYLKRPKWLSRIVLFHRFRRRLHLSDRLSTQALVVWLLTRSARARGEPFSASRTAASEPSLGTMLFTEWTSGVPTTAASITGVPLPIASALTPRLRSSSTYLGS